MWCSKLVNENFVKHKNEGLHENVKYKIEGLHENLFTIITSVVEIAIQYPSSEAMIYMNV